MQHSSFHGIFYLCSNEHNHFEMTCWFPTVTLFPFSGTTQLLFLIFHLSYLRTKPFHLSQSFQKEECVKYGESEVGCQTVCVQIVLAQGEID